MLAADQASKWLIRHEATKLPWTLVGRLRLELNYNTGISFSRFSHSADLVLWLVAAVSAGVAAAVFLAPPRYRAALGLILGGALGNVVDRLHFGAVVDFVGFYGWPTFNLGDVAIVAGTVLLVLQVLRVPRA